jgi:iron complex outermembrane receptor protein
MMIVTNGIRRARFAALLGTASLLIVTGASAQAQETAPQSSASGFSPQDIIVTARKRQESILNVPVIETAIPQATMERLQTTNLQDIARLTPGLAFAPGPLANGVQVAIRGVGTTSEDPGVDQSVSLNLDGLALGHGLAFVSGLFDLGQAEILKGPQALFYGKSSPGGVVSLRTADPTDKFELIARAGYEFEAREKAGELILSGPVGETLKLRVAGKYSDSDGYFKNDAVAIPGLGGRTAKTKRVEGIETTIIRGTALWNPSSTFNARLKVNYVHDGIVNPSVVQLGSCPDGVVSPVGIPFINPSDDCKVNRRVWYVEMDPANFPGIPNNGTPYLRSTQKFGTLELNYNPADELTLTSTTGVYNLRSNSMINLFSAAAAGPMLAGRNLYNRQEYTQELRLNSDYDGPLNFTVGAFYQDGSIDYRVTLYGNSAFGLPALLSDGVHHVKIKSYSGFGQLRYKVSEQFEIAAGARYTDETRRDSGLNFLTNTAFVLAKPKIHAGNVSPELTLTYKPDDDLTFFGSLKRGFKSGSFNITNVSPAVGLDNSFADEKVQGGELGVKARLADRRLTTSFAIYDYYYSDLQVGSTVPLINGIPTAVTLNAGKAHIYGAEFDASYHPEGVEGLSLNAALNYNHARYTRFLNAPCYGGQLISEGCNSVPNPSTGAFTGQDLSGSRVSRTPDFSGTVGFSYELPVGNGMALTFTNANQFWSKFGANPGKRPDLIQKGFVKIDLGVTLTGRDARWEIGLIAKNINDKVISTNCSNSAAASELIPTYATGTNTRGIGGIDELACYSDPGRSISLRLTLRPFN